MSDELLTVAEAAARLRVTPRALYGWLRSGRLQGVRLAGGRGWRIHAGAIEPAHRLVSRPAPGGLDAGELRLYLVLLEAIGERLQVLEHRLGGGRASAVAGLRRRIRDLVAAARALARDLRAGVPKESPEEGGRKARLSGGGEG